MSVASTGTGVYASSQQAKAGSIDVVYFTDPLCCWSWVFEPEWQKLLTTFKHTIRWRYCMGGLLPDWNNYYDAANSISKPLQMGPMWMHAAELTGITLRDDIWAKDPPASSYPACIAVKTAALQSIEAGNKYLYLLRKACMQDAQNIARLEVLINIAEMMSDDKNLVFDIDLFKQHLRENKGKEAFRKDLQEVRYFGINRFPSIVIKNNFNHARLISGYYPFETIAQLINQLTAEAD